MTTGEKIANSRKKLGLTQSQLAEEMGVTRQAVSRWESDLAFPETDTLVRLSKIFGCSIDWLLNYNEERTDGATEEDGAAQAGQDGPQPQNGARLTIDLRTFHFEYKSKLHIGSLPLVHIDIGLGRVAKGVISVGLVSVGVVSVGLLSLGVFAVGILALGLLALGSVAAGVLAAGGVGLGVIALGGFAAGLFSMGGAAFGLFAFGGYAAGHYVAIGDIAVGGIAIGKTSAQGTTLSVLSSQYELMREAVYQKLGEIPEIWAVFIHWSRGLFDQAAANYLNIKVKV